jgi:CO dehydrogenase maturation factor
MERLKEKMQGTGVFERPEITPEEIPPRYVQSKDGLVLVSVEKVLQSFEGCACPMGVLSREFLKKLRLNESWIAFVNHGLDIYSPRKCVRAMNSIGG